MIQNWEPAIHGFWLMPWGAGGHLAQVNCYTHIDKSDTVQGKSPGLSAENISSAIQILRKRHILAN